MIAGIEIEIGHATLTTPIFAVVCHLKAKTSYSLDAPKFHDSNFSRSRDITEDRKFYKNSSGDKIANVNLFTTISHTYFKIPKR